MPFGARIIPLMYASFSTSICQVDVLRRLAQPIRCHPVHEPNELCAPQPVIRTAADRWLKLIPLARLLCFLLINTIDNENFS
jgi:hypothetical protein